MRELKSTLLQPNHMVVKEVNKQKVLATLVPHRGHSCYEYDLATRTFHLAEFEDVISDIHGKVTKRVKIKEGCLYTTALNPRNADKRFIKMILELMKGSGTK